MLDLGLGAALLDALPRAHPCQLVLVGARPGDSPRSKDSPENSPTQRPGRPGELFVLQESSADAAGRAAARAPAAAGPGGCARRVRVSHALGLVGAGRGFAEVLQKRCRDRGAGDADQLPPVGPGSVLGAAIAARAVPVEDLRDSFRQERQSAIVTSAHQIHCGAVPALAPAPAPPPLAVRRRPPRRRCSLRQRRFGSLNTCLRAWHAAPGAWVKRVLAHT